jgi:hypothetical protein
MSKLRCVGCGQRYYGLPSHTSTCDFCLSPLEDTGWSARGRRATMTPLPVVPSPRPPAPGASTADTASIYRSMMEAGTW